jgi:hypothetical protein
MGIREKGVLEPAYLRPSKVGVGFSDEAYKQSENLV